MHSRVAAAATFAFALASARARAEQPLRIPLPEPIFTETVTDIDGVDSDVEVELNGEVLRALRGGGSSLSAEVEAEWLLLRKIGFRLEGHIGSLDDAVVGGSAGLSWKLLQDFVHDRYLQAEIVSHTLERSAIVAPGESPLAFAFDLRGGQRVGPLTIRAGLGLAAGGTSAHFPLRASLALMTGFAGSLRFGFWGIELDADGARGSPFVLALNLEPNLAALRLPFRIGLAVPWNVDGDVTKPSVGLYVRIFFESPREVEYGRTGK